MEELINQIKEKLNKEAIEPYTKAIAEYLISAAEQNEDLRSMILDSSKTLGKCFDFIRAKAKSQAKNGCAYIRNDVVYKWAVEYYGMTAKDAYKIVKDSDVANEQKIEKTPKAPDRNPVKKESRSSKAKDNDIEGQMDMSSFWG